MVNSLNNVICNFTDQNYASLGTSHGLLRKKTYLAYNDQAGWQLTHLNIFKRIARFFGAYQSTHLNKVMPFIQRENDVRTIRISNKMIDTWNRTYPKAALPKKQCPLAGEWYHMKTSQYAEQANNACTSIALFTLDKILANPEDFDPTTSFNQWIIKGSKKHLEQYGTNPVNNYANQVIRDLKLKNLKCEPENEFIYDPALAEHYEEVPQTREELTQQAINKAAGKPFAATLSDGRETIALYYKSDKEMYIFDSHPKRFDAANGQNIIANNAYVVKFSSKNELDNFLFNQRYHFDEQGQADIVYGLDLNGYNGANQIDMKIFL